MIGFGTASFTTAAAWVVAGAGLLVLAGCDREKPEKRTATIEITADGKTRTMVTQADGDGPDSTVEFKLPGGYAARIKGPGGMTAHGDVDIDGVGLYPGARVGGVQVKVDGDRPGPTEAKVDIGFSAKSDPAAVADWYQQQFEAKGIAATRSGDTLTGRSKDGHAFTVTALANKDGGTAGTIAIRDGG